MHPLSERRKKVRCQKVKTLQLRLSERVLSEGCFYVRICAIIVADCRKRYGENRGINVKKGNRALANILLCGCILVLSGCGGKNIESKQPDIEPVEQSVGKIENGIADETEASEWEGDGIPDSVDVENELVSEEENKAGLEEEREDSDEENEGKAQTLPEVQTVYEAQIRHYYSGILSQLTGVGQLPGLEELGNLHDGKMSRNRFAVKDIDGDGREELIIRYSDGSMAGTFQVVYGYDPTDGELKMEFCGWPAQTYYDNGIINVELSHNHSYGRLWPFDLFCYETESDSYIYVASVSTWDKAFREEWAEGKPFPDELDTDGDGTLYLIRKAGEEYSHEYEDYKYNQADFEQWFNGYTEGAKEIAIEYQPIEYESFADFTPAYLRMKAEEAGRERTDTADDLGLLILYEDYFLVAAENLLSEKYGVELGQSEPDFEEHMIGLVDGREVFSFAALDMAGIVYSGEKVGDVTIFGIYPGISVDDAWEKLQAYGFYACPYREVENCLITGEGIRNIAIWFSAEDNKVTQITVMPFCAYAG